MEHFDKNVNKELRTKCLELAEYAKDNLSMYGKVEAYGTSTLDTIEGNEVSGFIPHQCGGYSVSELIRFDMDASYHLTPDMSEYAEKQYDAMLEAFKADNNLTSVEWDDLTEEQQNELRDYEYEWFEPALLMFEVWVGEKDCYDELVDLSQVHMRLAVNYRDAPYYQSNNFDDLHSLSMFTDDFMKLSVEDIYAKLLKSEA